MGGTRREGSRSGASLSEGALWGEHEGRALGVGHLSLRELYGGNMKRGFLYWGYAK